MKLIYPGSFDPITLGHIDIIKRGSVFADELIVSVLYNPAKKSLFSVEERIDLIKESVRIKNVTVDFFDGLLADYVKKVNASAILRGVRNSSDFENEKLYAVNNYLLCGVDTVFLPAGQATGHISSSIVKEIAAIRFKKDMNTNIISDLVPQNVSLAIKNKFL